jgi:hypothetical protein
VCEFVASSPDKPGEKPVRLLARSNQVLDHWYWGLIVHDFAGMKLAKPVIQIDWCHDHEQAIGVAASTEVSADGLAVSGKLISTRPNDLAADLIAKAAAGIPYEASIDFNGPMLIETVPAGATAEANGQTFTGPLSIVREWQLRSVAICPFGYDTQTRAEFSQDDAPTTLVHYKEFSMTPDKASTNPPPAAPPAGQPSLPPADFAAFRDQLKQFTDRFGAENGTAWFTAGKTYAEACDLHATAKDKQCQELIAKVAELEKRLSAVPRGEKPLDGTPTDGEGKRQFTDLFRPQAAGSSK